MIVQVRAGRGDAIFDVPALVKDAAPRNPPSGSRWSTTRITATGTVREVSPRADPVTGTFAVRVQLTDAPAAMRLGSTVKGNQARHAAGHPVAGRGAGARRRRHRGLGVDPKSRNRRCGSSRCRFERDDGAGAKGLAPGDIVVTAGVQVLRPGQKVRLLEPAVVIGPNLSEWALRSARWSSS